MTVARTLASSRASDEDIIRSFPCHQGPGVAGFVVDFLGTRTRTAGIAALANWGGVVEGYPLPQNFHATALEWAGALRAVRSARTELTAIELGAGWAPWLVAVVRAGEMRDIQRFQLVGVEGSRPHCETMHVHFADNGIDPAEHRLLHGVVGPADGVAEFPVLSDPAGDWGAEAIFPQRTGSAGRAGSCWARMVSSIRELTLRNSPRRQVTERVPCFSLTTLLKPFDRVNLVHVDIQGAEYEVIASAREALAAKAQWLVIATHGRAIERKLRRELASRCWVLVAEERCQYQQSRWRRHLMRDGCQVWRHRDVADIAGPWRAESEKIVMLP